MAPSSAHGSSKFKDLYEFDQLSDLPEVKQQGGKQGKDFK